MNRSRAVQNSPLAQSTLVIYRQPKTLRALRLVTTDISGEQMCFVLLCFVCLMAAVTVTSRMVVNKLRTSRLASKSTGWGGTVFCFASSSLSRPLLVLSPDPLSLPFAPVRCPHATKLSTPWADWRCCEKLVIFCARCELLRVSSVGSLTRRSRRLLVLTLAAMCGHLLHVHLVSVPK